MLSDVRTPLADFFSILLEPHPRGHNRPYQLERQGDPGLERWQRKACRFLGEPSAGNHGHGEIQKALLQWLPQADAPLG